MNKLYVIKNFDGLYWNNQWGWVSKDEADVFNQNDAKRLQLPMGAMGWVELKQ
jgi:hypothetical protein